MISQAEPRMLKSPIPEKLWGSTFPLWRHPGEDLLKKKYLFPVSALIIGKAGISAAERSMY